MSGFTILPSLSRMFVDSNWSFMTVRCLVGSCPANVYFIISYDYDQSQQ